MTHDPRVHHQWEDIPDRHAANITIQPSGDVVVWPSRRLPEHIFNAPTREEAVRLMLRDAELAARWRDVDLIGDGT